jgi:hypothetical protein
MLGEPDLDFTRLTRDAASGGQVEVHGALSDYQHVTYPCHADSFAEPSKERSAVGQALRSAYPRFLAPSAHSFGHP